MLNYIWFGLLAVGIVVGIINGRIEAVTQAAIDSAGKAVELGIGLLGVMCLWTGLMGIAEKSGLVKRISRFLRPVLEFLFPHIPKKHPAMGAVVMNLVANLLGLGNAATPLGLKAMNELQKLNPGKDTATNAMCMFLVLNTSAIQLIPATIIAVRSAAGSQNPA
ncbi:MAG: nucleoside recognition protein, partial [Firmicutes bacterium]|nr:nucleoside recognition protein [Bacillota bacterium]